MAWHGVPVASNGRQRGAAVQPLPAAAEAGHHIHFTQLPSSAHHPAGQVTTWDNNLLIFGGHGNDKDLTGARWYNGNTGQVASNRMASARWYPGA